MSFAEAMNVTHRAKDAEARGDHETAKRLYRVAKEIDLEDAREAEMRMAVLPQR